jgi:hypothetical protein
LIPHKKVWARLSKMIMRPDASAWRPKHVDPHRTSLCGANKNPARWPGKTHSLTLRNLYQNAVHRTSKILISAGSARSVRFVVVLSPGTAGLLDRGCLQHYLHASRRSAGSGGIPRPSFQLSGASSSCENRTRRISFVLTFPLSSFSTSMSCCASGRPAGSTILPPFFS